jgi:hypothetical protein
VAAVVAAENGARQLAAMIAERIGHGAESGLGRVEEKGTRLSARNPL